MDKIDLFHKRTAPIFKVLPPPSFINREKLHLEDSLDLLILLNQRSIGVTNAIAVSRVVKLTLCPLITKIDFSYTIERAKHGRAP